MKRDLLYRRENGPKVTRNLWAPDLRYIFQPGRGSWLAELVRFSQDGLSFFFRKAKLRCLWHADNHVQ